MANKNCFYLKNKEYESPLHEIRVRRGYTVDKLAKECKMQISQISALANGTMSPLDRKGNIRFEVLQLGKVLNIELTKLFPRYICEIYNDDDDLKIDHDGLTQDQLNELTQSRRNVSEANPSCYFNSDRFWNIVKSVLTIEEFKLISEKYLFGNSFLEIGKNEKHTKQCMQIKINKILNKLRRSSRMKYLEEFLLET